MNNINRILINDQINKHPPYAGSYRREGSECYRDFSKYNPFSREDILEYCTNLTTTYNRKQLHGVLHDFNSSLGAGELTLTHIKALNNSNTFAIIAGHQPVLFGGQLFILYKIASAISLCRQLNSEQTAINFVPIFWNASEDHNLDEFATCRIFDESSDLASFALPLNDSQKRISAEKLPAAEKLNELIRQIATALPQTEFLPDIIREIEKVTEESQDIGEMFSRLLLRWFDGLIIVEPKILRRLPEAQRIIAQALQKRERLNELFADDSAQLATSYGKQQLPPLADNETLVFHLNPDGSRERIVINESVYSTPSGSLCCSQNQLDELIMSQPERFSPSAALRPVLQSTVLPAAVYVAGGGELSYHFQLRGIFREFSVAMPLLLPRSSGTILKSSTSKGLNKFNVSPEDILTTDWSWEAIIANLNSELSGIEHAFSTLITDMEEVENKFADNLLLAGISNLNEWKREKERFFGRIEGLQRRYTAQNPLLGDSGKKQYYRLRKFILPAQGYQDIHCWTLYFLALFGSDFLKEVINLTDPLSHSHHLFQIS